MLRSVWWLLWVAMQTAMATDLATCSRKWVKMNDRNFNRALGHYAECVLLGQALDPPDRHKYQSNILMNLKKSCNYFLERTSLTTSDLIGVIRAMAEILEDFEEDKAPEQNDSRNISSLNVHKTQCAMTQPPLYDYPFEQTTISPIKFSSRKGSECGGNQSEHSSPRGYLFLMLLFFFVLLVIQIIFLTWFCCFNNCMFLELWKAEEKHTCQHDTCKLDLQGGDETCHTDVAQYDLASLSSENVGSEPAVGHRDSEFEALLKMNKLPKGKRPFHCKEAD